MHHFRAGAVGDDGNLLRGVLIFERRDQGDLLGRRRDFRLDEIFALDPQIVAVIRGHQNQRVFPMLIDSVVSRFIERDNPLQAPRHLA